MSDPTGLYIPVYIPGPKGENQIVGKAKQNGHELIVEIDEDSLLETFLKSHQPVSISISGFQARPSYTKEIPNV